LPSPRDVLCFSQLRWDFVYQRPHHLMVRAARDRRVWYIEEPVWEDDGPRLAIEERGPAITTVRPIVPAHWSEPEVDDAVSTMLQEFAEGAGIERPIAWYYTPMALPWSRWLRPAVTVYDCMDELSAFRFAPPRLGQLEAELFERADVVFTGGASLYHAKRERHPNVHAFPSSVDADHFRAARVTRDHPADQAALAAPRIGWFGVIDERMDLDLLSGVADLRPEWSLVLLGPTVKIDPATIPVRPNIHVLGPRPYGELPTYLAGWDVAMMPFARNESTRFISPTKTLEYLAAGKPVISTSIHDVVDPFERLGLVRIADTAEAFVAAIEAARADDVAAFTTAADVFLEHRSWDETWARMSALINAVLPEEAQELSPDPTRPLAAKAAGRSAADSTAGAGAAPAARPR
jgi:glycosyltransferase involved in cell wall biosynthesis